MVWRDSKLGDSLKTALSNECGQLYKVKGKEDKKPKKILN